MIFHSYVKLPEGKFPEKLDKPHSGPVSAVPNQVGPQGISLPGSSQNYRRWTTWQSPGFFFGCCFGVKFVKCYKTHLKETSWKKKKLHCPFTETASLFTPEKNRWISHRSVWHPGNFLEEIQCSMLGLATTHPWKQETCANNHRKC